METEKLQLAVIWYIVFVFSVVLHEAAHAFVGLFFGDHTATQHGLTTLNPVPHIQRSPIGMVIVPLLSFVSGGWMIGWASTPYDPYWAAAHPKQAALKTLAGPASNLILLLIASVLIHIGISAGIFYPPESINFTRVVEASSDGGLKGMAVLVSILFTLNLVLLIFNLIPVPPLDGVAIGEFIFKGEMLYKYREFMSHHALRVFGIFIAWMIMSRVFGPIHLLALNALYFVRGISYG